MEFTPFTWAVCWLLQVCRLAGHCAAELLHLNMEDEEIVVLGFLNIVAEGDLDESSFLGVKDSEQGYMKG